MKLSILMTTMSILVLGQHALASPLVSPRQDQDRVLRCDLGGGTSIETDTTKCASERVFCKGPLGVVISVGTAVAYDCLQKCGYF